jgi:type VI secretion system protein
MSSPSFTGFKRMINRFKFVKVFIATSLVVVLSGCLARLKSIATLEPPFRLAVTVKRESNTNSPIAFDLVAVNDKDLAKQLSQMTAADWFQKRGQIKRDFPKESSIKVQEWEWVPGQVVHEISIPVANPPRLLLAFANYSSPGPHRAKLDLKSPVLVTFDRTDFELSPLATNR